MLLETLVLLSNVLFTLDISPIGESTKSRLQTVQDGVDTRGEGFSALLDHVENWEGSVPFLTTPDRSILLSDPELFRGDIFLLSGVVELVEPLGPPWEGVEELFIRDREGNLFGLYMIGQSSVPLHQSLQIPALFYKTISIEGRDKQIRVYPTFVSSNHVILTSANQQMIPNAFLAIILFVFVVFVFYWIMKMTKRNRHRKPMHSIQTKDVLLAANETAGELPEKPSEALAIMYDHSRGDE